MAVPIYDVEITPGINAKINGLHGVTADEVRGVCYSKNHSAKWNNHPKHGRRLLVTGIIRGGKARLQVILHPVDVDQGKWRLRTAIAEEIK